MTSYIRNLICELMGGHSPQPGIEIHKNIYKGRCQFCKNVITSVYPPHWQSRTFLSTNTDISQ